jgi:sulfur carrier protein ThiS
MERFKRFGTPKARDQPGAERATVNIKLKLFATLSDFLPAGAVRNEVSLSVSEGRTVGELIGEHHLPDKLVHLVLVNGSFVAPAERSRHLLKDGDTLAIWPPVAGG